MAVDMVFETHSISLDNERGVATGWLPGELAPIGRQLAAEMGRRRCAEPVDAVFCSDLARAVETATIAFEGSGIPVYQDARLRECNYGALNGMPVAQLVAERSRRIDTPFPDGQSYRDVLEQTRDFLRDLAANWDGKHVVLVSHSANRWALDCLLNGARLEDLVDAPFNWQEGWRYTVPADLARVIP